MHTYFLETYYKYASFKTSIQEHITPINFKLKPKTTKSVVCPEATRRLRQM